MRLALIRQLGGAHLTQVAKLVNKLLKNNENYYSLIYIYILFCFFIVAFKSFSLILTSRTDA